MPYDSKYNKQHYKYRKGKYHRIGVDIEKEEFERLKAYCDKNETKINTFIKSLLKPYTEEKPE